MARLVHVLSFRNIRHPGSVLWKSDGLSTDKKATALCFMLINRSFHSLQGSKPWQKILNQVNFQCQPCRHESLTSFFNKVSAEQLWKGVTSVSNAGKKRGRGKGAGRKLARNLNRGQMIGVGKANIVWPGLSTPIIQGNEIIERHQLPPDPEREAKLIKLRDSLSNFRSLKLSPLERGWSGTKMHGRSVGPPDPIGQDTFEGFDTKILEMKTVAHMDANLGRRRRFSVLAFTGNKNGLCGFAESKSPEGKGALRKAKNRAGQRLLWIERYNNHTVLHDFFTQFGHTKIFVYKKPAGFGLVCHRAIATMCEMIGIKDLYAKIEGSINMGHIVKAFMLGLLQQKSHETLAEEKSLYLVEQREENYNFPVVVAAPSRCRTEEEIPYDETLDFSQIGFGDRIPLRRAKYVPFFTLLPSWERHLSKTEWRRNHNELKEYLFAEYGGLRSHLSAKHPESDGTYAWRLYQRRKAEEAAQEEEES